MNLLSYKIIASAVVAGVFTVAQLEMYEEPVAKAQSKLEQVDKINKQQQIEAARIMYSTAGGSIDASVEELVAKGYLKEEILNNETLVERVNKLSDN